MNHHHKVFVIGVILLVSWVISYQLFFQGELPDDYEPQVPIEINGEADWDNYPGIITGSGTESDPYLIEGYEITDNAGASIIIRDTASYVTIRRNHLQNNMGDGIYLENVKNAEIYLNLIDYCGRDGIRLENTYNTHWMNNILIYDNTLLYNSNNGISLINAVWGFGYPPKTSKILGLSGHGGGNAIMQNVLIENNVIAHSNDGVYIQGLQINLIVQNNEIWDNGYGINVNQAYYDGDNKIQYNNIYNNGDGIYARVMQNFDIIGNTFDNNNFGVIGAYTSTKCHSNIYYYNRFYDGYWGDELPSNVEFDDGLVGNYWWNYPGNDNNGDGIGDSPHNITTTQGTHQDRYPIVSFSKPLPFNLTSDADMPDPDRSFTLSWLKSQNALSYSIYRYNSYITEINSSVILIVDSLTNFSYDIINIPIGEYYFVVLAENGTENTTSNNIHIIAGNYPQGFTLTSDADNPDDGYFTLTWSSSTYANYYNVYSHYSIITEINSSVNTLITGSPGFSLSINGISDGNYYFVVEAVNLLGKIFSNNLNVIVGDAPTPFNLTSDASDPDGDGNFTLRWTVSANSKNYTLYEYNKPITEINSSLTSLLNETTQLSYSINDKTDGTYFYIVVAHNELANTSSNCINVSVGRLPSIFMLTTNASDPDLDGNYHLNWTSSLYAANYSLYEEDSLFTSIDGLSPIVEDLTNQSYCFYNKSDGVFYYTLVAHNIYGETMSNVIQVISKGLPKPFELTGDAGDPDNDGNYTLSWTNSIIAENYTLYESESPIIAITGDLTRLLVESSNLSYIINNKSSGIYYYIVLAKNNYGNITSNSINVSVGRIPEAFTLYTNADYPDKDGDFIIYWTISSFAENYSIFIYENNSFQIIDKTNKTSYAFIDLVEGHYTIMVLAENGYGSIYSSNGLHIIVDFSVAEDEDEDEDDKPTGITPEQWIYIGVAASISIPAILGLIYYAKKK